MSFSGIAQPDAGTVPRSWVGRHPLPAYFALCFGISWGGILIVLAATGFSLDSDGRITGAFAPDPPRSATAPFLPTPWRGRFSDYRLHGGLWLPFVGEVAWDIDGEEVVYWRGRIDPWTAQAGEGAANACAVVTNNESDFAGPQIVNPIRGAV